MNGKDITGQNAIYARYIIVWFCLLVLLAATIEVSRFHIRHYAVVAAISIATLKSGLVVNFFMHLKEEPLILKVMLFLALFALALIILLTFSDVWYRSA